MANKVPKCGEPVPGNGLCMAKATHRWITATAVKFRCAEHAPKSTKAQPVFDMRKEAA